MTRIYTLSINISDYTEYNIRAIQEYLFMLTINSLYKGTNYENTGDCLVVTTSDMNVIKHVDLFLFLFDKSKAGE